MKLGTNPANEGHEGLANDHGTIPITKYIFWLDIILYIILTLMLEFSHKKNIIGFVQITKHHKAPKID